jgi:AcrR family transcriptional regulator
MQSRQDLLDATKRLVAAEGARATTVARITAEAGLAKGLFFYYFK